jgi:hypothetical protein
VVTGERILESTPLARRGAVSLRLRPAGKGVRIVAVAVRLVRWGTRASTVWARLGARP